MRTVSTTLREALNAAQTHEVMLVLLKINHTDMATPIYVVNNTVNIVSSGNVYLAFPFQINLPDERDDQPATVTLAIDNVDRSIVEQLRSLDSPPTVEVSVVLAVSPSTVEAGPFSFTLRSTTYNSVVVSATLAYEDILREPIPGDKFTPVNFPGIFAGVS